MTSDLPPSARLVARVLDDADGDLTRQSIEDRTGLPTRTTQYALRVLIDRDRVERHRSLEDLNKWLYATTPRNNRATADL